MKNIVTILLAGILISLVSITSNLKAEDITTEMNLTRVGGDYIISNISKTDKGFEIEFVAKEKTGEADIIVLQSDHVHFGLDEGSEIRISAEVDSVSNERVEAYQVLVYLPAPEGYLPVWLLSSKSSGFKKGGMNYLKMHAPQSDFMVF